MAMAVKHIVFISVNCLHPTNSHSSFCVVGEVWCVSHNFQIDEFSLFLFRLLIHTHAIELFAGRINF